MISVRSWYRHMPLERASLRTSWWVCRFGAFLAYRSWALRIGFDKRYPDAGKHPLFGEQRDGSLLSIPYTPTRHVGYDKALQCDVWETSFCQTAEVVPNYPGWERDPLTFRKRARRSLHRWGRHVSDSHYEDPSTLMVTPGLSGSRGPRRVQDAYLRTHARS